MLLLTYGEPAILSLVEKRNLEQALKFFILCIAHDIKETFATTEVTNGIATSEISHWRLRNNDLWIKEKSQDACVIQLPEESNNNNKNAVMPKNEKTILKNIQTTKYSKDSRAQAVADWESKN